MQTTSCTWPYVVPIGEDPAAHGHWCTFTDLYHTMPYHTMRVPCHRTQVLAPWPLEHAALLVPLRSVQFSSMAAGMAASPPTDGGAELSLVIAAELTQNSPCASTGQGKNRRSYDQQILCTHASCTCTLGQPTTRPGWTAGLPSLVTAADLTQTSTCASLARDRDPRENRRSCDQRSAISKSGSHTHANMSPRGLRAAHPRHSKPSATFPACPQGSGSRCGRVRACAGDLQAR